MLLGFVINFTLFLQIGVALADPSWKPELPSLYRNEQDLLDRRDGKDLQQQKENLCPPLEVLNQNVTCMFEHTQISCAAPAKPRTTAILTCSTNKKPDNLELITCFDSGRWSNPLPKCIPECGFPKESIIEPLIVNGVKARVGLFPWHAGLYYRKESQGNVDWEQKCGGSLISEQFVLTAGHCIYGMHEEDMRIALGKIHRSWNREEHSEQKFNVSKILNRPEFSNTNYAFDIALILLDRKVKFGDQIMPVCIWAPGESNNIQAKRLFISGWGRTENTIGARSSEILLYKEVMAESGILCKKTVPYLFPTFEKFCLEKTISGSPTNVSVAQPGDSGGGVTGIYEGQHYIFGLISVKITDNVVLTNVTWPYHLSWIEEEMSKYDERIQSRNNLLPPTICKQEGVFYWTCKKLSECPEAQEDIKIGLNPEPCNVKGNYVCCKPPTLRSEPRLRRSAQMCRKYAQAEYTREGNTCATSYNSADNYNQFPHLAQIYALSGPFLAWKCLGSLISERYVLTSSYCVDSNLGYPPTHVSLGKHKTDPIQLSSITIANGGVLYEIMETMRHPAYINPLDLLNLANVNNVALIKLKSDVQFNKHIRPICLQTETKFQDQAIFPTWPESSSLFGIQLTPGNLQKETHVIQPLKDCSLGFLDEFARSLLSSKNTTFCTYTKTKRNPILCNSYSYKGAPLQVRLNTRSCMYSLVGVLHDLSPGPKITRIGTCYPTSNSFFSNVEMFVPWIESVVWQ